MNTDGFMMKYSTNAVSHRVSLQARPLFLAEGTCASLLRTLPPPFLFPPSLPWTAGMSWP